MASDVSVPGIGTMASSVPSPPGPASVSARASTRVPICTCAATSFVQPPGKYSTKLVGFVKKQVCQNGETPVNATLPARAPADGAFGQVSPVPELDQAPGDRRARRDAELAAVDRRA